jgi:SH3 domain protein
MKRTHILWIIIFLLCFAGRPSWAARVYVTDSIQITVRTGPSTENRIVALLSSGEPVESLETRDDWTRVRLSGSGGDQKEGWVLSRYLMDRQPWQAQNRALLLENTSLREKSATLQKNLGESSQQEQEFQSKLQQTTETLNELQIRFDSLKKESSEFLTLKEQYDTAQSTLQKADFTVQELTEENAALRSSQNTRWFLVGALVFVSALLIGLIIGRRERKRRTGLNQWTR